MGFRDLMHRLRRTRRLRFQYGLRSLMLATLAVCLALGWYVGWAHLTGLRRLSWLEISDTAVGDNGLEHLAKLAKLEVLFLRGTLVTDHGLASLAALKWLRHIDLRSTAVSNQGLRVLEGLASLESLNVAETAVTPEGAAWLKHRLPKLAVDFDRTGEVANRAHVLMRAGRWREALAALKQFDRSYLGSVEGLSDVACCHAELGEHEKAARLYCAALDQIPSTTSPFAALFPHMAAQWLWFELFEIPPTFEHMARLREHDPERWLASARRAVVEGHWSVAAEQYRRAIECSPEPDDPTIYPEWFEYGLSQLLAGNLAESRRFRARLFDEDRRLVQTAPEGNRAPDIFLGWQKGNWYAGTRLAFAAPQGEVDTAQISQWSNDAGASLWKDSYLLPLVYCREGKFKEVLAQEPPAASNFEPHYVEGRFWFPRAIAQRHLGRLAQARECYSRGVQWLDRNRKIAGIRGDYDAAGDFLEAEILRREAERLIYE
jgi:tetratricopeptide (TPR) repeat protein